MFIRKVKGQSTAEYAVVLSVIIAAVIGMQIYVKRGLQARVKSGTDAFTSAGAGFNFTQAAGERDTGITATFSKLSQYEPYYSESSYDTYSENVEQEHMGGGQVVKEKISELNVRKAGGYQKQRGAANATERDETWNATFGR